METNPLHGFTISLRAGIEPEQYHVIVTDAIVESSQVLPKIVLLVLIALQIDIFGSARGVTWRVKAAYDAVAEKQTTP